MIPKILHQIWIGVNELPKEEKSWIESWKRLHPEWKHILWTNDNIPVLPKNLQEVVESVSEKYALAADVYRYFILHNHGGFYVDTDMECFKNINDFLSYDFVGMIPRYEVNYITNSFFGVTQKNKILNDCMNNLKPLEKKDLKFGYLKTGPVVLTRALKKHHQVKNIKQIKNDNIKILTPKFWDKKKTPYMLHYARASHIKD